MNARPTFPRPSARLTLWAGLLLAWGGERAHGQLGSYNHQESGPPVATRNATTLEPALPQLQDNVSALIVANAEPEFPALVSRVFSNLRLAVPDNSAVGAVHAPVVSGVPGVIGALQVQLTLSPRGPEPMFNGDLFVTLSHESGYAVLLNRVGRREGSAAGYADNGFTVTLADTAAADVHTYRQTVTGNELTPISTATPAAPLTGTWQPDGRTADPGTVLTSSPRITSLGAFTGLDPNGEWTLFVADLGAGGLAQLDSWSLEFTVVPEPHETAALTAAALAALALARRRQRKGG
jgi:MYXO-CTERM domain-containing protein